MRDLLQVHQALFAEYDRWFDGAGFSCAPGCATCCTVSVTATESEAAIVAAHLGTERLRALLDRWNGAGRQPARSTNGFARDCLAGRWDEEEPEHELDPCPFLEDNRCVIYAVRPFVCRSFSSTIPCEISQAAEVAPWLVSLNTMVQQIIEHLCAGQAWGNFLSLLSVAAGVGEPRDIPGVCLPLPAIMVPPWELERLRPYAARLLPLLAGDQELENILSDTFGLDHFGR